MLRSSRKVRVKTYPVASAKTFTVTMHTERVILGIVLISGVSHFLVEEPEGNYTKEFSFQSVALDETFDKPNDWSYLGETPVVVDPDADRPCAETRYVYGLRAGQRMGGAL